MRYDILLCGVGGQGIITLSEILATAAISKDLKAIVTQDRGLAQRGGSVKAHVRMGDVHSPMIPKGHAHALLSLEMGETLGYSDYLNPDTVIAASTTVIAGADIPKDKKGADSGDEVDPRQVIRRMGGRALIVDAEASAAELGVPRAANIFLLGVVFGMDSRIAEVIDPDQLIASIKSLIRRKPEENVAIFQSGMKYGAEH
jgi:indolepyruvate ferredoxin oxidoreductase beta subunit